MIASDLPALSRLLGTALDLEPAQREPWLAALADEHRHLIPRLREMLAEHASPGHPSFMANGPRLADAAVNAPAALAALAGDAVGAYRLVREIGRGGMSSVWLAERLDGTLKRDVALKMPLLTLTSSLQIERFERERDLLAMLTHPQIARLYDAGVTPAGQPFIVLELVDGLAITAACDLRRLDVAARLRVFMQALEAVGHAHKHLIVHRDIKPSNVFVDAQGQVKLLDFGIAKLLVDPLLVDPLLFDQIASTGPTALTRDAGCALTPGYAAPEQMDGRPISTATDVYALGVLLYELLTGRLPNAGAQASMAQALAAALHVVPERPSRAGFDAATAQRRGLADAQRLQAQLAGDLDTIVLKALRKNPAERYGSVEAFAADLTRYLEHRPISARAPSLLHRARLFMRRHRRVGVAAGLGLVGVLGFAVAAYQQHSQSLEERARGDSVRDFMFDLVGDAEPDESHASADITGRQMVDRAVLRARADFRSRPRLQGELLGELGHIYGRLGEAATGSQLHDEALALLEAHAPPSDPVLNDVRAQRAASALQQSDVAKARLLAGTAVGACTSASRECARVRTKASNVLSKIASRDGKVEAAIQLMTTSLTNSEIGFGSQNRETAMTLVNLAVIQRNAGRLLQADAVLARALAMSRDLTLRSSDRIELFRTQAVLDLDLGRFEAARARLAELAEGNSGRREKMLQLRFLADALLALGEPRAARERADAAIALATPAESASTRLLFARQSRARADGLLGVPAEAAAEMAQVRDALLAAGYAANTPEVLRARRFHAELLARAGAVDAARRELDAIVADPAPFAAGSGVEQGQALDLLGSVLRESNQAEAAPALHARARALLEPAWPASHPWLQRNALYAEAARWQAGPLDAGRERFKADAQRYVEGLPATSTWRSIIGRFLNPATCPAADGKPCALLL